jgi:hypothetical protein
MQGKFKIKNAKLSREDGSSPSPRPYPPGEGVRNYARGQIVDRQAVSMLAFPKRFD